MSFSKSRRYGEEIWPMVLEQAPTILCEVRACWQTEQAQTQWDATSAHRRWRKHQAPCLCRIGHGCETFSPIGQRQGFRHGWSWEKLRNLSWQLRRWRSWCLKASADPEMANELPMPCHGWPPPSKLHLPLNSGASLADSVKKAAKLAPGTPPQQIGGSPRCRSVPRICCGKLIVELLWLFLFCGWKCLRLPWKESKYDNGRFNF